MVAQATQEQEYDKWKKNNDSSTLHIIYLLWFTESRTTPTSILNKSKAVRGFHCMKPVSVEV